MRAPGNERSRANAVEGLMSVRRRRLVAQRPQVLMEIRRVSGDRLQATTPLVAGALTSDREARPSAATASSPG